MYKLSHLLIRIALISSASAACAGEPASSAFSWVPVSGSGIHYLSTADIHSVIPTEVGMIQRSTDIVELDGDLRGRLIYQPVSVFDFVAGTLTNTGNQVFSGTVLGSDPVLVHDDEFRFDVNLLTGETVGLVHLNHRLAGPKTRCELEVIGSGMTDTQDALVVYTGRCKIKRRP